MTNREFFLQTIRGFGFKIVSWRENTVAIGPMRAFPPPNTPRLILALSREHFSLTPTLPPGHLTVLPPPEGWDYQRPLGVAYPPRPIPGLPVELHPEPPPPPLPELPRPTKWWLFAYRESAPHVFMESLRESITGFHTRVEREPWPRPPFPRPKKPREGVLRIRRIGNYEVVRRTNPKGVGTIRVYVVSPRTGYRHWVATVEVSDPMEAERKFIETVRAIEEGTSKF